MPLKPINSAIGSGKSYLGKDVTERILKSLGDHIANGNKTERDDLMNAGFQEQYSEENT